MNEYTGFGDVNKGEWVAGENDDVDGIVEDKGENDEDGDGEENIGNCLEEEKGDGVDLFLILIEEERGDGVELFLITWLVTNGNYHNLSNVNFKEAIISDTCFWPAGHKWIILDRNPARDGPQWVAFLNTILAQV